MSLLDVKRYLYFLRVPSNGYIFIVRDISLFSDNFISSGVYLNKLLFW